MLTNLRAEAKRQFNEARRKLSLLESPLTEEIVGEMNEAQLKEFSAISDTHLMRNYLQGMSRVGLEERPVSYLRVLASRRGVKFYTSLDKDELIRRIRAYDRA